MVKFIHMADVHLGGWKQEPMQELNFQSFQKVIDISIKENPDFVLIAGDLFDTAYPGIEVLKETFAEFKKLHDAKIPSELNEYQSGGHNLTGSTFSQAMQKTVDFYRKYLTD